MESREERTGSKGQERLTRLCSAYGKPFPFMITGNSQESVISLQESDFPTEESRRKFIKDRFKIDENKILNRDAKLKEEVIKLFLENFFTLALHPNHCGKTDLLELRIE